jgi:hypothetical protein
MLGLTRAGATLLAALIAGLTNNNASMQSPVHDITIIAWPTGAGQASTIWANFTPLVRLTTGTTLTVGSEAVDFPQDKDDYWLEAEIEHRLYAYKPTAVTEMGSGAESPRL